MPLILNANRETITWTPETEADHRLVQRELSAILSSHHFRNSKRYPLLLRYVVEKCLDGQSDHLKERTLGVEVFGRRPDYDTNADPVVRFTAGEVRKKIAQYYQETNGQSEIQIGLPLGSYVPEFTKFFSATESANRQDVAGGEEETTELPEFASTAVTVAQDAELPETHSILDLGGRKRSHRLAPIVAITVVALLVAGGYFVYRSFQPGPIGQLWGPLFGQPGPVLVVVSGRTLELTAPEPAQTSMLDHMIGPYHHVSVSTAIAMSLSTAVLQQQKKSFTFKEASATGLPDLRERSVILIGALNNEWTLRLIQPLRYRFVQGPLARIEDTQNPANHDWTVDFSQPFTSVTQDFAVVARYRDASTNGTVLIIAGLGPYGTEAAGEFVSTPQYLEQISRQIPNGLKNRNVEMVIRTDIIAGEAGPPRLVAATAF